MECIDFESNVEREPGPEFVLAQLMHLVATAQEQLSSTSNNKKKKEEKMLNARKVRGKLNHICLLICSINFLVISKLLTEFVTKVRLNLFF